MHIDLIIAFLFGVIVGTGFFTFIFFVWLRRKWKWIVAGAARSIGMRLMGHAKAHIRNRVG